MTPSNGTYKTPWQQAQHYNWLPEDTHLVLEVAHTQRALKIMCCSDTQRPSELQVRGCSASEGLAFITIAQEQIGAPPQHRSNDGVCTLQATETLCSNPLGLEGKSSGTEETKFVYCS